MRPGREKKEVRKQREGLQRQLEQMSGFTAQARISQPTYHGQLGYGMPEPILQAAQADITENGRQDWTPNNPDITCYS